MAQPLGGFKLTDPFTTSLGWKIVLPQTTLGAHLYVNNQTDTEFDLWGDGYSYLGKVPAWLTYADIQLNQLYSSVEFRSVFALNVTAPVSFYVSAMFYEATEKQPNMAPIAVVRQTDIARQQRTVMVPIGLSHFYNNLWGGVGTTVVATFVPSAAQLKVRLAGIYLYYANLSTAIGGGVVNMGFTIEIQWRDGGGGAVGVPFVLARGEIAQSATSAVPWVFAPLAPYALIGQIPVGAATVDLQITNIAGGPLGSHFTIAAFMDPVNTAPGDGEIGFGALYTPDYFAHNNAPFPFF